MAEVMTDNDLAVAKILTSYEIADLGEDENDPVEVWMYTQVVPAEPVRMMESLVASEFFYLKTGREGNLLCSSSPCCPLSWTLKILPPER